MNNKKVLTMVIGALAVGMLLSYGIFAYASVLSPQKAHVEGIRETGLATIKVFNQDGALVKVWKGHNSLLPESVNGLVGCVTGATTTPDGFGSCSSWINYITIYAGGYAFWSPATNTPFAGTPGTTCDPTGTTSCTGWVTSATFSSSVLTSVPSCTSSCTVTTAGASQSGGSVNVLDFISTSVVFTAGDSLQVTITFTIS